MSKLFLEARLGAYSLSHRVVMAPLTRMRAGENDVPGDLMVEYYAQRASKGGLIVAEATPVSPWAVGYFGAPGIFTNEQVAGWKRVVDAVHAKGARIFLQVFHAGRQSHTDLLPGNGEPLAPSAIESGSFSHTREGWKPSSAPRALNTEEIAGVVEEFRLGAEFAKAAGFDGVEIHAANGYLIDQFLQTGSNQRTDSYGGSAANRARFLLEVTQAVVSVWGGDRVGVRVGPSGKFGGMSDSNPAETFGYVAEQLNRFNLAYLHIIEPRVEGSETVSESPPVAAQQLRAVFKGPIIAAGGFTPESANAVIEAGVADLVAFGRHFVSNPDLPERVRLGKPLAHYDRDTFYAGVERGYTDYPAFDQQVEAA
ncbi:alkene reductase [Paraburkholderia fungorum]|uniref:alkene reductase n=1 Tax=Paraburkholderia fungorum TaxID=134537 RepID=UPI0038B98CC9